MQNPDFLEMGSGKRTIATVDLGNIHMIFSEIQKEFPENSNRHNYFLATCKYLYPDFDIARVKELRPFGGLIGIDDSRWDRHLNSLKILRLHAFLHDAAGFVYELHKNGPGYNYILPCSTESCLSGHVSGIAFCLYVKVFHPALYGMIDC